MIMEKLMKTATEIVCCLTARIAMTYKIFTYWSWLKINTAYLCNFSPAGVLFLFYCCNCGRKRQRRGEETGVDASIVSCAAWESDA